MMDKERKIEKVDFSMYKDKYDENLKVLMESSPKSMDVEKTRTLLYGYTFTADYAKGILPDELSMDYWRDRYEAIFFSDEDADYESFDAFEDLMENDLEDGEMDNYEVDTIQERLLLEAIDSTGDGKSPETALCVIDVSQEYEYLRRVFPFSMLQMQQQSFKNGIDCLTFKPNTFKIDHIYFDISRRFEKSR